MAQCDIMGDVKEIPLTGKQGRGRVALIDDEDYALVSRFRWYAKVVDSKIYAATSHSGASGAAKRPICMHVFLTGYDLTDHRNGDGLDNQRENLRVATQAQNLMNRGYPSSNTSGFKGVSRKRDKWVAGIKANGVHKRLGGFTTPEQAARAYDAMAIEFARRVRAPELPR